MFNVNFCDLFYFVVWYKGELFKTTQKYPDVSV